MVKLKFSDIAENVENWLGKETPQAK